VSGEGGKFQFGNRIRQLFIPTFFGGNVMPGMDSSTPRLAGLGLRLAAGALRTTSLPRFLSRRVVERKLREIDFAAEGEPPPFYMPVPYRGKHRR
jgi:hypothetical protein